MDDNGSVTISVKIICGAFANYGDASEKHDFFRAHPESIGGRVYSLMGLWVWEVVFPDRCEIESYGWEIIPVTLDEEDLASFGICVGE
jgi:hypothetical protein